MHGLVLNVRSIYSATISLLCLSFNGVLDLSNSLLWSDVTLFSVLSPSFFLFFFHFDNHFCGLISIILMLIILCVIGPWLMRKKKLLPQKQLPVERPSFHINETY